MYEYKTLTICSGDMKKTGKRGANSAVEELDTQMNKLGQEGWFLYNFSQVFTSEGNGTRWTAVMAREL